MAPRSGAGPYGREEPAARNPRRPLAPLLGFGGNREGGGGRGVVLPRPDEELERGVASGAYVREKLRYGFDCGGAVGGSVGLINGPDVGFVWFAWVWIVALNS